jgi:hypothetical protein
MTTPVAKRADLLPQNENGQITIFFASSLIILITVLAFVVNIGLFVKAKINLQNATDASAYAGASVQSQQLTRIAYLNWEMRNVFKEWMYKYYVLGNLNVGYFKNSTQDSIDFTMNPATDIDGSVTARDYYNFPSVCIHFSDIASNVCKQYAIPGIPRFDATNLIGIDETTSALIDSIVKTKATDCSNRSKLNFFVANLWAYNVLSSSATKALAIDAPTIAADRPGAWPKAVELALRIRNLEYGMNRAPVEGGICGNGGGAAGSCSTTIGDLGAQPHFGNERAVKAFWSGYRNLGNADMGLVSDSEMKTSFTMTELKPTPLDPLSRYGADNLSVLLMKKDQHNSSKYYLDLKLMAVNYATFFTALVAKTGQLAGTQSDSGCDVTKIAIPVPGYPLGFYKNPEVMTYYAVKGEANFVGLFNPFQDVPIKLTAFSAAKPMGGRIGPMLFREGTGAPNQLRSRESPNTRSLPYIMGLDIAGTPTNPAPGQAAGPPIADGDFAPGVPIPINSTGDQFWIRNINDPVGGYPINSGEIYYGIPNMIYDLEAPGNYDTTTFGLGGVSGDNVFVLKTSQNASQIQPITLGLFYKNQYQKFLNGLGPFVGGTITPDDLSSAIELARAPTEYEAGQYLIPTTAVEMGNGPYDTFGFVTGADIGTNAQLGADAPRYNFSFYAPLYSPNEDVMFKAPADIIEVIQDYLTALSPSIKKFSTSMNQVAIKISSSFTQNPNFPDAENLYEQAANVISDIGDPSFANAQATDRPKTCKSINGYFMAFLMEGVDQTLVPTDLADCPDPLMDSITYYYSDGGSGVDINFNAEFYNMTFRDRPGNPSTDRRLTAYMPGPLRGGDENGLFQLPAPLSSPAESMRRNSYSTKFIPFKALKDSGSTSSFRDKFLIYSENNFNDTSSGAVGRPTNFFNFLESPGPEIDL